MNRKIFTLLAAALMLCTTAFNADARQVAQFCVGDYVKSLPKGKSEGRYHIQADSICLRNGSGDLVWVALTAGNSVLPNGSYFYDPSIGTNGGFDWGASFTAQDTIVLAATESGNVRMISAKDFRTEMANGTANMYDLQASMWCVETIDPSNTGHLHTFRFTNKSFQLDLDWDVTGQTIVSGAEGNGWMFSGVLTDLDRSRPFRQLNPDGLADGFYRVVVAELEERLGSWYPTGNILMEKVPQDVFVTGMVEGMLKFSIVKVTPYVLTHDEFNTKIGNVKDGRVQLKFDRTFKDGCNVFSKYLVAEPSAYAPADALTYLNVRAYETADGDKFGYIGNSNLDIADDADKYSNEIGSKHINLRAIEDADLSDDVLGDFNHSYRFVYFPSEDSLVINAYHIKHDPSHPDYPGLSYTDDHNVLGGANYLDDTDPTNRFNYGLYSWKMQDRLIVRRQDLTGTNTGLGIMTVGYHPSNVKIKFDINCNMELLGWQVSKGLYTIWDDQGRCLGVQIYNGSYTPQWIELKEGECPDRIPSYQWIVEPWENSKNRINIINRELGHIDAYDIVQMRKILVAKGEKTQIFKNQSQFLYGPILDFVHDKYEPINYGWVEGQYIQPVGVTDCTVTSESGFRPVAKEYAENEFLGYKHFNVQKDPMHPSLGKSEDIGDEKGMDYNAFAFKYLHSYDETFGINLKKRYNDTLLNLQAESEGFRFLLPDEFKSAGFEEEIYGYPWDAAWPDVKVYDENGKNEYKQGTIPVLRRYYYHLKVADFYQYRDGLAEQYVVLKGLGQEWRVDYENELYYGVADVYAASDPFKFLRVYLRETYFFKKDPEIGEERSKVDPSRRIYYTLLDRVDEKQIPVLSSMGLEITNILKGRDATSYYGLVSLAVDDHAAGLMYIKAQGRNTSARVSTFSLHNMQYELYRRLRSKTDDFKLQEGEEYPANLDAPKVLRIHRDANPEHFLYEDAHSDWSYGRGINFLGVASAIRYPEEGSSFYNYHLYIDTAYIERGTGPIKPQYLIAVDPVKFAGGTITTPGAPSGNTNPCVIIPDGEDTGVAYRGYTYARYLVNLTDSARGPGSDGDNNKPIINDRFVLEPYYDRLAFVEAIHVNDTLYILSEVDKTLPRAKYTEEGKFDDGVTRTIFNIDVLAANAKDGVLKARTPQGQNQLGAFYVFEDWDNYHNDVTFSLRFVSPTSRNANKYGEGGSPNENKVFYIESEGTSRTPYGSPKIAPMQGGWISIHNEVPILSRFSYHNAIFNAEKFNVQTPLYELSNQGIPTSNDQISDVQVIAGVNEVTVLNAAKKRVTVSNLMGQTIVSTELTSDNQSIPVAKGMVVVTVEGEKAIKAVIK